MVSSQRDDLIFQIVGKNKKEAEKYADFTVDQLKTTVELLKVKQGGKGVTPHDIEVDDGNNPNPHNEEGNEDEYTDEMFEEEFKASGL